MMLTAVIHSSMNLTIFDIFYSERMIVILAMIALLLDGLDGFIARKYDHVTKFGEKIDVSMYKHPDALIKDLENEIPQVLCFSIYVWNFRLSYEIASRVKNRSPNTVVVFGGPNFPLTSDEQELMEPSSRKVAFNAGVYVKVY